MHNTDSFSNKEQYKVSRKSKVGIVMIAILAATSVINESNQRMINESKQKELSLLIPSVSTEVSIDQINEMNLILNDSNCSDTLFQDVVNQLREDGIQFSITQNEYGVNENDSTIITLDQQYNPSPQTVVFAPYNNTRVGHSDSLALAMKTAFEKSNFPMSDIVCGQNGYQQDEDGSIQTFFPTSTEEAIDEAYDSSFVTISFGTTSQDATTVAKSIENALARQLAYLNEEDSSTDLIYRANSEDDLEGVANYFGTDIQQLRKYNLISDSSFRDNQTIINPSVITIPAFDFSNEFQICETKTRSY